METPRMLESKRVIEAVEPKVMNAAIEEMPLGLEQSGSERAQRSSGEHLRIRDAIGARDAERAREEMRARLEHVESDHPHARVPAAHG
jgi:DNA-binding FadR family transcriptional regulator